MAQIDVLISVNQDWLDRIPELLERLQAEGLINPQALEAIGVITGSVDEARMAAIAAQAGVAQIEPAQEIQISLPDTPAF